MAAIGYPGPENSGAIVHDSIFSSLRSPIMAPPFSKDRRTGIDRRQFSYDLHIPERRRLKDRRRTSEPAEAIQFSALSDGLVARLISDSCHFHQEEETEALTYRFKSK
jgi:hypothetical protein